MATPLQKGRIYIALDLETTGFDPVSDYPIEVAAIKFDENGIYERYQTLINPGVHIPQIVTHITGIRDEDVSNSPRLDEVKQHIADFIADYPIVGHNINFDTSFLRNKGFILPNPEFDTVPLTSILYPNLPSYSLETISSIFDIAEKQNHRALSDTIACATLFQKLLAKIKTLDPEILRQMSSIFAESAPHLSDMFTGGTTGGIYIKENFSKKEKKEIQTSEHQQKIEEEILKALSGKEALLAEIGIGNGKYTALTNAILQHHKNHSEEKTLITLATPNLQEHLFTDIFPQDDSIVLVKEANRYLSLERLTQYREKPKKSLDEMYFMAKIYLWSTYTQSGEHDEISFTGDEYRKWENVNVNRWRCDMAQETFIQKADEKQEQASVLVCYHRALAQNIMAKESHLKNIQHLIICEANLFEKHIFSASSKTFSLDGIEEKFNMPPALAQKMEFFFGMLGLIFRKYNERDSSSLMIQDIHKNTQEWQQIKQLYASIIELLKENLDEFPDMYGELLEEMGMLENLFGDHEKKSTAIIFQNHEERIRMKYMPLDTMGSLWQLPFFEEISSKIFISSTMRVAKSFDYIRDRLAIEESARELVVPPKPSLTQHFRVIIPSHLPEQEKSDYTMHANALLSRIIKEAPGKTVAIFGSKRTLHSAYYGLATNLKRQGIDVLSQDFSGGKGKIAEKYKNDPEHTALFGTFAFLEKIELSQLPCQNLIFQKIPFDPPFDPMITMQTQRYMDSFIQYSLPEAILRFLSFLNQFMKNSLAKKANTTNNIYIFDIRILKKSWGKALIDSLPEGIEVREELP